jgi:hypothetical protein
MRKIMHQFMTVFKYRYYYEELTSQFPFIEKESYILYSFTHIRELLGIREHITEGC